MKVNEMPYEHIPFDEFEKSAIEVINGVKNAKNADEVIEWREKYLELLNYAYSVMPGLSVTSDVIVGFPGETYEEFLETVSMVEEAKFTSMYTFIFSSREGTVN